MSIKGSCGPFNCSSTARSKARCDISGWRSTMRLISQKSRRLSHLGRAAAVLCPTFDRGKCARSWLMQCSKISSLGRTQRHLRCCGTLTAAGSSSCRVSLARWSVVHEGAVSTSKLPTPACGRDRDAGLRPAGRAPSALSVAGLRVTQAIRIRKLAAPVRN